MERTRSTAASEKGRLHRGPSRASYAVGHPGLSQDGRWMAAVLACDQDGRKALLSHRSAAELWGLLCGESGTDRRDRPGDGGRKRRAGIRVHRSGTLEPPRRRTRRRGIPVTEPHAHDRGSAQGQTQSRRSQRRAAATSAQSGGSSSDSPSARSRCPTAHGATSSFEFLEICRRHRLPTPEVNSLVDGIEVDFLWRTQAGDRRNRQLALSPRSCGLRKRPRPRAPAARPRLRGHPSL